MPLSQRRERGLGRAAAKAREETVRQEALVNIAKTNSVVKPHKGNQRIIPIAGSQITMEELANAEFILERGSKKKFNQLSLKAMLALCSRMLEMDVANLDTKEARQALHQYVSWPGLSTARR